MWLILLVAAVNASTYTLGRALIPFTTPTFLIGIRLFFGGLIFFGWYLLKHKVPKINKRAYFLILQITFFGFSFPFILEFIGLKYMTGAKTAFLYSLSPVFTAFFSYFAFNEKMTWKKGIGLGLALFSFMPILISQSPGEGGTFLFISWPELYVLVSVISFVYSWVLIRQLIKRHKVPASFINGFGMLVGGVIALVVSFLIRIPYEGKPSWIYPWLPITDLSNFIIIASLLVLLGCVAYYALYTYCLKKYTATIISFSDLITPLFAAIYGWTFLSEAVRWYFFPSLIVLLLGMHIFYSEERRLGYLD